MEMVSNTYLKGKLKERGIEIEYGRTFAGNPIRFFVYKGQKIYFDTECNNGGTVFCWKKREVEHLLFALDHVEKNGHHIYGAFPFDHVSSELDFYHEFDWGYEEYMIASNFSLKWGLEGDKLCRYYC